MRLCLCKLAMLGCVLYAVSLSAQTVDEIIAKNIQAHGGRAKLKTIQSMRVAGDFSAGGMQASFTQVFKRPMKLRLDATVQEMTFTQAYDGQNGWQVVPFTGKTTAEPMAGDDLDRIKEQADFDGPLIDYKEKGNTIQLIGKEKVDGVDAYHLKITLKNGNVRNFYIDTNSFFVIQTINKTKVQGMEVEVTTKFNDYREVEGVKLPFSIDQQAAGGQVPGQKITFQKVEMNFPVEDSFFKMPAGSSNTAAPATNQPEPAQKR